MTKNIYLIGMIIYITPLGLIVCLHDFFYNNYRVESKKDNHKIRG